MIYISFDIGVKNLAYCILSHNNKTISIIDWNIICLAEKKTMIKGANNISNILFFELDNIISKLDNIDITFIDKVLIENQPSNINGVMKTIQYLIFSYFDLLRHWDKKVEEVILINPSLKLQNHSYIPSSKVLLDSVKIVSKREKYVLNKKDSIEICIHYINNDENLLKIFNLNKKKDDLADTYLQAISYIHKNFNIIDTVQLADINLF